MKTLLNYINLRSDLDDHENIHQAITNGITFKGTNLWILVFAIFIASVGLNMNSTAVIIGAMLISPLMGPINGMGYSLATYDFALFQQALRNFGFAVGASLMASTIYFAISPLSTAHSELLARTSPTIYDVLIAWFGGLAGIVAMSSKHKGNVIPGVAIATALMPPLCTAGYGLATGQFMYFFGAFYLFTINTVFIGLSAMLISQILKFPNRTIVEPAEKRRVNRWISFIIVITIIPSIYFGYKLVQKEEFIDNATRFTNSISVFEGSYLLKHEMIPASNRIELTYGGAALTDSHKNMIIERANDFSLGDVQLVFRQGFSFSTERERQIDPIPDAKLKAEINRLSLLLKSHERYKDSLDNRALIGQELLREAKALYPEIIRCAYSETFEFTDSLNSKKVIVVVLAVNGRQLKNTEKQKIGNWVKAKFESAEAKVYFDY